MQASGAAKSSGAAEARGSDIGRFPKASPLAGGGWTDDRAPRTTDRALIAEIGADPSTRGGSGRLGVGECTGDILAGNENDGAQTGSSGSPEAPGDEWGAAKLGTRGAVVNIQGQESAAAISVPPGTRRTGGARLDNGNSWENGALFLL